MLRAGITGGIGSGKTTVCRVFNTLGIPVFYADDAAKMLMNEDPDLRRSISALLGEGVYNDAGLDRLRVAAVVFGNTEKLQALNALVHPATLAASAAWMARQTTPYAIKEAAVLFESGSEKQLDVVIGVYAPAEVRLQRAMARSNANRATIEARMAQQMDEEEKMMRCDFVIRNNDISAILPQILNTHQLLLKMSEVKAAMDAKARFLDN